MVGTLRYAAPERLGGRRGVATIRRLGPSVPSCTRCSPACPAVTATDPVGALAASQAAPATLEGVPPTWPRSIAQAMATDPADRYPDAVALRDALAADGAPVDPNAMTAVVPIAVPASPVPVTPRRSRLRRPVPPLQAKPRSFRRWVAVDAPSGRRGSMRPGILTAGLVLAADDPLRPRRTSLLGSGTDGGTGSGAAASTQPTASATGAEREAGRRKADPEAQAGQGKGKDKPDGPSDSRFALSGTVAPARRTIPSSNVHSTVTNRT